MFSAFTSWCPCFFTIAGVPGERRGIAIGADMEASPSAEFSLVVIDARTGRLVFVPYMQVRVDTERLGRMMEAGEDGEEWKRGRTGAE